MRFSYENAGQERGLCIDELQCTTQPVVAAIVVVDAEVCSTPGDSIVWYKTEIYSGVYDSLQLYVFRLAEMEGHVRHQTYVHVGVGGLEAFAISVSLFVL